MVENKPRQHNSCDMCEICLILERWNYWFEGIRVCIHCKTELELIRADHEKRRKKNLVKQ